MCSSFAFIGHYSRSNGCQLSRKGWVPLEVFQFNHQHRSLVGRWKRCDHQVRIIGYFSLTQHNFGNKFILQYAIALQVDSPCNPSSLFLPPFFSCSVWSAFAVEAEFLAWSSWQVTSILGMGTELLRNLAGTGASIPSVMLLVMPFNLENQRIVRIQFQIFSDTRRN